MRERGDDVKERTYVELVEGPASYLRPTATPEGQV
jgi:hypothetical protein